MCACGFMLHPPLLTSMHTRNKNLLAPSQVGSSSSCPTHSPCLVFIAFSQVVVWWWCRPYTHKSCRILCKASLFAAPIHFTALCSPPHPTTEPTEPPSHPGHYLKFYTPTDDDDDDPEDSRVTRYVSYRMTKGRTSLVLRCCCCCTESCVHFIKLHSRSACNLWFWLWAPLLTPID